MTLEEFQKLSFNDRRALRHQMFGAECPAELVSLRDALVAENERTGTFPEKWTDQVEDDCE